MERGGDDPEEADQEVDLPERIPLPDHSESRPKFSQEVGISLTQPAKIPRPWMPSVWELHTFQSEHCSPSFHTSLQAFVCDWPRRAGWPEILRCDQGTHDRDVLSSTLTDNGAMIRPAGSGIPKQISKAGRRGDMSKKMVTKAIKVTYVSGRELKDMNYRRMPAKIP